MAWTQQQERAIKTRDTNIIVSAGAGSGKTAVLSERILDYALSGKDIRKLLILTFTNAAAGEMKERIRSKLIDNGLNEQAELIDVANITTFDAYSLSLVKKYYYRLDLDKNIKIMDSALIAVKCEQILDAMFTEKYENRDRQFLDLLQKYATQDDKKIKEMILELAGKLELLVDEEEFINTFEERYFNDNHLNNLIIQYEKICLSRVEEFINTLKELTAAAMYDTPSSKLYNDTVALQTNLEKANNYDELAVIIKEISIPRVSAQASIEVKELKTVASDMLKKLKDGYFSKYLFKNDMKEEILATKGDVLYLLQLCQELNEKLLSYKKSLMQFNYGDIAKMAIKLVKDFKDVHDEVADNLEEILIDEYQDTSDIQEAFISYISKNNCYMVGDIKQSIYRFRNANPYIFKNKYEKYALGDEGIKIDLTFNFRSRKEVLANINNIFEHLMTDDCGDADYAREHQMIYGLKAYDELKQDINFNMEILGYDSVEGYDDMIVEAFICGNKIKELYNSKLQCLKKGGFKEFRYSDVAILIDKTKSFPIFKKVFEYLGIPLAVEGDLDLNTSILPKLFANTLIVLERIKNNNYDIPYRHALASIARSFLVGLNDEEIYYLLETNNHQIIDKLKKISINDSYEDLFMNICECFDIYEKLPLIGDVENSLVVLEYIYNLFKTISDAGMVIEEASDFFSSVFDKGIELKYKLVNNSKDSVRIMTIHKSKGLEFAYCIFPMLGSSFNKADLKKTVGLSPKYGIYVPFSDEGNSDTIIKALVNEASKKEDISEKVRLLYVALTRAREKIILISNEKDYSDNVLKKDNYGCFNHMIRSLEFMNEYKVKVDTNKLGLTNNLKIYKNKELFAKDRIEYNNNSFLSNEIVKQRISKELKELTTPELQRAISLGLEFHECLEVLDFKNIDIDNLETSSFIKNTLRNVLKHQIFNQISQAKTYHEHEFYFEDKNDSYHGIIDLLVEYDDHIDIIDYKLANTESEEYVRQLKIYKNYVNSISDKMVNCYLLSILKQQIKKIDV